jgi:hypothetical protein
MTMKAAFMAVFLLMGFVGPEIDAQTLAASAPIPSISAT